MTKRFSDYLKSIALVEQAFLDRVEHCLGRIRTVSPEPIVDIFVEDLVQEDGTRIFLHFGAFSKNYIFDISDFRTDDNVSMYRHSAGVRALNVATSNYEFREAKPESRLSIRFALARHGPAGEWRLQATGANCDHIWALAKKHLIVHMSK